MSKKPEWDIPLKISLIYEESEDLEALKTSNEFLELIHKGSIAAIKQAIRKNKSECVLFEITNHNNAKIKIKKDKYKNLISNCIQYYENLEDYSTCQELLELQHRL